jgi:hypothetical protein
MADKPDDTNRLLTEIRDDQREMMAMYRAALARQRFVVLAGLVVIVVLLLMTAALMAIAGLQIVSAPPLPNS